MNSVILKVYLKVGILTSLSSELLRNGGQYQRLANTALTAPNVSQIYNSVNYYCYEKAGYNAEIFAWQSATLLLLPFFRMCQLGCHVGSGLKRGMVRTGAIERPKTSALCKVIKPSANRAIVNVPHK